VMGAFFLWVKETLRRPGKGWRQGRARGRGLLPLRSGVVEEHPLEGGPLAGDSRLSEAHALAPAGARGTDRPAALPGLDGPDSSFLLPAQGAVRVTPRSSR